LSSRFYWHLILERPRLVIGAFALLFLLSLALLSLARFNFSFEPKDVLSGDEYAEVVGIAGERPREMLALILKPPSEEGVDRKTVGALTERLSSLPDILHAVSEARLPEPSRTDFFRIAGGRDLILMELAEEGYLSIQRSRDVIGKIDRQLAAALDGSGVGYELVGPSPTRIALHAAFRRDVLYVTIPLAIIILLMPYILYRSWSYVILPGISGLITVSMALALYGYFGEHFTYFSMTLAPLLLCLALMDAMYLVDRFWAKSRVEDMRARRIRSSIRELIFPCALTSATTAMGFASLAIISDTPILKEYGLFAAIGIVLALAVVFLLIPAMLRYWPEPGAAFVRRSQGFGGLITSFAVGAFSNPRKVIFAFILCSVLILPFMRRLYAEGSFERFFSSDHPTQRGIDVLSDHLGSLAPITFTVRSTGPEDSGRLMHFANARFFERWLEKRDFIRRTLSPLSFLPEFEAASRPGETILDLRNRVSDDLEAYDLTEAAAASGGWIALSSEGGLEGIRVVAWPKKMAYREFETFMTYFDNYNRTMMGEFRAAAGGAYLLERAMEERFLRETLASLALSGALVLLVTLIPLGSWRLGAIFLVVNCLPLALVAGLMGLMGIPFSLALIGLPCILFGVIVDDSIHTLWAFKRTGSVQATYDRKGRAILITSLLLVIAFGGQVLSAFKANRQFGELAAAGIALAFLADLFLAPALLRSLLPLRR